MNPQFIQTFLEIQKIGLLTLHLNKKNEKVGLLPHELNEFFC